MTVEPRDGARARLFVAPTRAWITLEAGEIVSARYLPASGVIRLTLDPARSDTPVARLFVRGGGGGGGRGYAPASGTFERGGYTIALGQEATEVVLRPR